LLSERNPQPVVRRLYAGGQLGRHLVHAWCILRVDRLERRLGRVRGIVLLRGRLVVGAAGELHARRLLRGRRVGRDELPVGHVLRK
jgi:hypothetical protein